MSQLKAVSAVYEDDTSALSDAGEPMLSMLLDLESCLDRERERREADRGNASRCMAMALDEAGGPRTMFLHNRRWGRWGGTEVSHLAVTPSGVWVVEGWQYDGARVDVARESGPRGTERLLVGGRDKTVLVGSLVRQYNAVATALQPYDVPVRGLLCFMGASLPRVWRPSVQGFDVVDIPRATEQLRGPGPIDDFDRQRLMNMLCTAFPPA